MSENLVNIKINQKEIQVDKNLTVMQACEIAGEEIPRFCYHEKLSIAGNCRMCLVELEKSPLRDVRQAERRERRVERPVL